MRHRNVNTATNNELSDGQTAEKEQDWCRREGERERGSRGRWEERE